MAESLCCYKSDQCNLLHCLLILPKNLVPSLCIAVVQERLPTLGYFLALRQTPSAHCCYLPFYISFYIHIYIFIYIIWFSFHDHHLFVVSELLFVALPVINEAVLPSAECREQQCFLGPSSIRMQVAVLNPWLLACPEHSPPHCHCLNMHG